MERLLEALRAVGEHTRLRILALVSVAELTVGDLTTILGQSQPRVSRHLKILCDAGLLDRVAEGTQAFFRVTDSADRVPTARALIDMLPFDATVLARDQTRLDAVRRERNAAASHYFEENARRWDAIRAKYVDESRIEAAMLEAAGDEPIESLLDLGTGAGRILQIFGHRVRRGLGVDLSREMLAVARAGLEARDLSHCRVRKDDICRLSVPAGSFELVTIHHVLHFLDDPARAVEEAARALRPGGRLLIADFAPHHVEQMRTELAHRRLGFSDHEVSAWCLAAGLHIDHIQHLEAAATDAKPHLTVTLWVASQDADAPSHHDLEVA